MKHWLVKQEPEAYSWDDLLRDKKTAWEGVRNFQARNNLQAMKKGDQVLFYHSVGPREVVGIAKVTQEAFPDPTADDPRWIAVELAPVKSLRRPVSLDQIKETASLKEVALIKQSRLSVMPLKPEEFETIVGLGR
jgi:predicted RNA-binding protein with PUA-like domain